MAVGAFGFGKGGSENGFISTKSTFDDYWNELFTIGGTSQVRTTANVSISGFSLRYSPALYMRAADTMSLLTVQYNSANVMVVSSLAGQAYRSNLLYGTANTTKASDGTLKAASPVARIVKSKEECQRPDIDETGFAWCGCGTANAEAEGITLSRLDVGVYVLTGSAGLASEGWRLLPPRDPDGAGDLGIVDAEETESGGITVRLYKRRYVLSQDGDIELAKGALIDVPANSWIDVRLDMHEDSIFNSREKVAPAS